MYLGISEFFFDIFGSGMAMTYLDAVWVTLKITFLSTGIAYLIGIPLGVILYGTSSAGVFPCKPVNAIVGFIVNVLRSIPFIILLVLTQPVAKLIVGTKIGDNAFIVYLVIASAPYVARMIESSLKEVDPGALEAARSMGSTDLQIVCKVLLPEAKPSLIVGAAITLATILGYTPMTYLIAGGGVGQLAIQYGLYRFNDTIMYVSSILLIILVQIMQEVLGYIARKTDKRIR